MSKPKAAVRRGLSMTTILVLMIVSLVGAILAGCLLVLFPRYEDSIVQNARTSSSQAVAQVTKTVSSYNADMAEVMTLLTDALDDDTVDRSEFLAAFLQMRPDVVAVSTYDGNGALVDCWSLGHTPRRNILQNLSFDRSLAVDGVDAYVSTPHVETIFDSYYPWVVTMAAHLSDGSNTRWVALDLSFASISSYISNVGIGQHNFWLVKRADHVLSARVVDRGLATNGGVDLCKQGRRDLDERDASLVASSRKAGEIPDHATAKGNQCSGSITALFEQVVEYRIERFPVLKLLAVCQQQGR